MFNDTNVGRLREVEETHRDRRKGIRESMMTKNQKEKKEMTEERKETVEEMKGEEK